MDRGAGSGARRPHARQLLKGLGLLRAVQQVVRVFIVDLHVADAHRVAHLGGLLHCSKYALQAARDDAAVRVALRAARDGEGLARPRLPVRKHGGVEARQGGVHCVPGHGIKHVLLRGRAIKHAAKLEGVRRAGIVGHVPGQVAGHAKVENARCAIRGKVPAGALGGTDAAQHTDRLGALHDCFLAHKLAQGTGGGRQPCWPLFARQLGVTRQLMS